MDRGVVLMDKINNPAADIINTVHDIHHVAVSAVLYDEQMHGGIQLDAVHDCLIRLPVFKSLAEVLDFLLGKP